MEVEEQEAMDVETSQQLKLTEKVNRPELIITMSIWRHKLAVKIDRELIITACIWLIITFFCVCGIVMSLKNAKSFRRRSSHVSGDDWKQKKVYYAAAADDLDEMAFWYFAFNAVASLGLILGIKSKCMSINPRNSTASQSQPQPSTQNPTQSNEGQRAMELERQGATEVEEEKNAGAHERKNGVILLRKVCWSTLAGISLLVVAIIFLPAGAALIYVFKLSIEQQLDIVRNISRGTWQSDYKDNLLMWFIFSLASLNSGILGLFFFIFLIRLIISNHKEGLARLDAGPTLV